LKNSILYWFVILFTFTACNKKQYASFCPGEKQPHVKHKTVSDNKKAKVKREIVKYTQKEVEVKENIIFEASTSITPEITENPTQERVKNYRLKRIIDQKPEKIEPVTHKQSIWAFISYFGGFFLFGIPVFIGLFWSISNLFYLRKRKKDYKMKGFSIAVAIFHVFITASILSAIFAGGAINGYLALLIYLLIALLGITGVIALIALALYAYGDNVF